LGCGTDWAAGHTCSARSGFAGGRGAAPSAAGGCGAAGHASKSSSRSKPLQRSRAVTGGHGRSRLALESLKRGAEGSEGDAEGIPLRALQRGGGRTRGRRARAAPRRCTARARARRRASWRAGSAGAGAGNVRLAKRTCPLSTGGRTRRVQLVRGEGERRVSLLLSFLRPVSDWRRLDRQEESRVGQGVGRGTPRRRTPAVSAASAVAKNERQ
jgi:hypothetical protein